MLTVLLKQVAIFLLVERSLTQAKDLLHLFRPKPNLPQELNDFLTDVQHHRKDFAFIRNVVKDRKKYERSYMENRHMFAEDIDDQMEVDRHDVRQPEYVDSHRSFLTDDKTYYPKERYSKFIHSPVRLRRHLENNYLNQRVKLNPNGDYGNIRRSGSKLPGGGGTNPVDGIGKREVEISIKSNGKLIKHIEENDNDPKSIILNIKSENTAPLISTSSTTDLSASSLVQSFPDFDSQDSGPSNSKTIPSLINAQHEHIGVPINSISARGRNVDSTSLVNKENGKETENYLPESFGVSGVGAYKVEHQQDYERPYKLEKGYEDSRWENSFEDTSDAQTNMNHPLNDDKSDKFEKVKGLIVDDTTQGRYMKRKRWDADRGTVNDEAEPQSLPAQGANKNEKIHLDPRQTKIFLSIPTIVVTTEYVLNFQRNGGNDMKGEDEIDRYADLEGNFKHPNEEELHQIDGKLKKGGHHHQRHERPGGIRKRSDKEKLKINNLEDSFRNRKHLAAIPKYKRKRVRQHPKQRMERELLEGEPAYYDLNAFYEGPDGAFDFVPSYRQRRLKSVEDEPGPARANEGTNDITDGYRKKFKSEEEYGDEEDSLMANSTKKLAIKKTQNQFAVSKGVTTEDNDDEYDYSDLTNMDEEDEDIAYEEEAMNGGNLEVEEVIENGNKNEHENDRLNFNLQKRTISQTKLITESAMDSSSLFNIDDVMTEAKRALVSANSRGHGGSKKKKENTPKPAAMGRRKKKAATVNRMRKRPRNSRMQSKRHNNDNPGLVSNQEKQELFLKYNPDFQRLPRFVQSDNNHRELLRQRAAENQFRYSNYNNFPNSNEYFLNPIVKREEPSTPSSSVSDSEAASSSETITASSSSLQDATTIELTNEEDVETTTGENQQAFEKPSANLEQEHLATLSQAAQDILKTVNSDNLMNTTVAEVNDTGRDLIQFTTNDDDLTQNTQCDKKHREYITPCLEESASHSPATITSVLPLIRHPESEEKSLNMTKDEFLDLSDLIDGIVPKQVVSEALPSARGNVRQSLRSKKYNTNLMFSTYNSSAETSIILNEMTNLMTKLKYHSTCQTLSPNLVSYIKTITRNEMDDPMAKLKEMNEIDFDEHQSNYMFRSGQSDNVHEKAQILKELLNKFDHLPPGCKERAEPVKEYIESHLALIDHMSSRGGLKTPPETTVMEPTAEISTSTVVEPRVKKEIKMLNSANAKEKYLEKQIIEEEQENREMADEGSKYRLREIGTSTSPQYGKLANAVRSSRNRREVIKRIGEIYGRPISDETKMIESKNEELGFESPRIINF